MLDVVRVVALIFVFEKYIANWPRTRKGWAMETAKLRGLSNEPKAVGRALLEYRQRNDLTLQDISETTGVSVGTLSKLENDKATPSFRTLMRIIQILDLKSGSRRNQKVSRPSARKAITRIGDALINITDQSVMQIHATELANKQMFPIVAQITLHEVPEIESWTQHEGDEFIYVLTGCVEVFVEQYRPYILNAGESTYYDSGMRHVIISKGPIDATVLSVSTSRPESAAVPLY
jgi:transcriptional regulator with XRE-family HTH domain